MKNKLLTFALLLTVISCTTNTPSQVNPESPKPSASVSVTPSASTTPSVAPTVEPTVKPVEFQFNPNAEYKVKMDTSMGVIKLKLYTKETPKTVENFVRLTAKKYYDGVTFHRVIDNFMIQGGDPLGNGTGGESVFGKNFEDEFTSNLTFNRKGLLAMANAGANTNGSQFFITLKSTEFLNNKHTIFGEVIEGMAIVEAIGKVKTGVNDKPVVSVVMNKVTVEE